MTAIRLDPLPPEHTPELAPLFDSFRRTLGFVPNSALTMQRKPKLLQAFVALQAALWEPDSKVDRGLKRLIAHVAARVAGCRYCQAHTASGALHFGVDDAKLAAIGDFRTSPLFTPAERTAAHDPSDTSTILPVTPPFPSNSCACLASARGNRCAISGLIFFCCSSSNNVTKSSRNIFGFSRLSV